jgi:hypothetical protein
MTHIGAALLLLALALGSVLIAILIAVKPAADPANEALVKKANTAGLIQIIAVGLVTITGVIAVPLGSWPLSEFWLWSSLVVVVFYCLTLQFITKPARLAVAVGGSHGKVGMQVALQIVYVLLLLVTFAAMMIKPH